MANRNNPDDFPIGMRPSGLLAPAALRQPAPPPPPPMLGGIEVALEGGDDDGFSIDPTTGAMMIEGDDGSVIIDLNPGPTPGAKERKSKFGDNLAELIDPAELGRIAGDLMRGIQLDDSSRNEWLMTRANGISILGLKIEPPRSAIDSTASLEGMSNIRHPMLLEAVLRFQANARGELLPSDGPVKINGSLSQTGDNEKDAEALETDLNYYLTTVATEYYPDTDRMLFYVGFGGCGFKKVYNCPLRRRPVSESVDAKDIIVSNAATDLSNSGRFTHVMTMRPSVLKRMQLAGAYRNVPISTPAGVVLNPVDEKIANVQGINATAQQTEDRDHTIYECYCELDIRGFEDKDKKGKRTELPLPYRVVIEKDSQQILEVRRNWKEDDETKTAKVCFVKFPYVPGLGFYDIGLIHILGNTTQALTAAWRELLDAGMFANFPGFLYRKIFGRQNTNEFRIPPGGGAPIDTDGAPISEAVMPLPYKDISPAFAQFIDKIAETGSRVGGTAEVQIAEGRQDAPVGTTLALIEQATKVEGAVHKRLHAAQMQEFGLLKECFRDNPESFISALKQRGDDLAGWDADSFLAALENATLVPVADPNTPSHMHRLMKAMALIQLDKAYPGQFDPKKLLNRVADMIRVDDFAGLLAPPQGPAGGMPPEIMLRLKELEDKAAEREMKPKLLAMKGAQEAQQQSNQAHMQDRESADQEADRQSRLQMSTMSFRESLLDNNAQLQEARINAETQRHSAEAEVREAEINAEAEKHTATQSVKVAEHGVKAEAHKVAAAKAKPKPKPAVKKA